MAKTFIQFHTMSTNSPAIRRNQDTLIKSVVFAYSDNLRHNPFSSARVKTLSHSQGNYHTFTKIKSIYHFLLPFKRVQRAQQPQDLKSIIQSTLSILIGDPTISVSSAGAHQLKNINKNQNFNPFRALRLSTHRLPPTIQ